MANGAGDHEQVAQLQIVDVRVMGLSQKERM